MAMSRARCGTAAGSKYGYLSQITWSLPSIARPLNSCLDEGGPVEREGDGLAHLLLGELPLSQRIQIWRWWWSAWR